MEGNYNNRDAVDKTFCIVAGVNGVGKSTFIKWFSESNSNRLGYIIDADKLALEYGSLMAGGRKALEEIDYCIENGINFCQETTLSSNQIIRTIKKARENGFHIDMTYLSLDTAEECIARVAKRVAEGGHGIPEDTIRRRFASRFECLCRVLSLCDKVILRTFDDSYDINALYFDNMLMDWNFNDRQWIKEFYQYYSDHGGIIED